MKYRTTSTATLRRAYEVERQTIDQIAQRYGMHRTSVRERLLRAGVAMRRPGRRPTYAQ